MYKINELKAASKTTAFWTSQLINGFSLIKTIATWFMFGYMASVSVSLVTFSLLSRDPISIARPSYNAVIITIGILLLAIIFAQAIWLSVYGMTHNSTLSPRLVGHRVNEIMITVFMMYHVIKIQAPVLNVDIIKNFHYLIAWLVILVIAHFGGRIAYRMLPKSYKVALPEDMIMKKLISIRYSWVTHMITESGFAYQSRHSFTNPDTLSSTVPFIGPLPLESSHEPNDEPQANDSNNESPANDSNDEPQANDSFDDNQTATVPVQSDDEPKHVEKQPVERRSDVFKLPSRTKMQQKRHHKANQVDKNKIPQYYSATIKETK